LHGHRRAHRGLSENTPVGVEYCISTEFAKKFASKWVEKHQEKHQEQKQKYKHQTKNSENKTMNTTINPTTTNGKNGTRNHARAKQFACFNENYPTHISTMVFCIYYDERGIAIDGSLEQRIRHKNNGNGLADYTQEFMLNIDGRETKFLPDVRYSIDLLKKAWIRLTNNSNPTLCFKEIKDWRNEHEN